MNRNQESITTAMRHDVMPDSSSRRPLHRFGHAGSMSAVVAMTVVAFYGPKPEALGAFIGAVHDALGAALGAAFHPRPVDDVHATIVGLEDAAERADDVAAFIGARLRAEPFDLQFGGFPAGDEALLSRGLSVHERSVVLGGRRAVVIGWPVEQGRPIARLGELRRGCARFGVVHKYHRGTAALDPDAYLVVGGLEPGLDPSALTEAGRAVRAAALDRPTRVPLTASDVSVVRYVDPALPRASSMWRRLS